MNRQRHLIRGRVSDYDSLTEKQIADIESVMTLFALYERRKFADKQLKEEIVSFSKLIFNGNYDNAILFMRYRMFRNAKKKALLRSKSEGYKMYVVRDSNLTYKVISTLDFKYNQRVSIMKKNVTAKEMEKISSLVVFPDGTTHGLGFSGADIDSVTKKEVTNIQAKKNRKKKKK